MEPPHLATKRGGILINPKEIMDAVDLFEMLWNEGLLYQLSWEIKQLHDSQKQRDVQTVMVLFKRRVS